MSERKVHFPRGVVVNTKKRSKALCGTRFTNARFIAWNYETTSCQRCRRAFKNRRKP